MSHIAVAEFLGIVGNDPGRLSELAAAVRGRSEAEAGEAVAAIGAASGFTFSGAEALAVCQRLASVSLSPEAEDDRVLVGVWGGTGHPDPVAMIPMFTTTPITQLFSTPNFLIPPGMFDGSFTVPTFGDAHAEPGGDVSSFDDTFGQTGP